MKKNTLIIRILMCLFVCFIFTHRVCMMRKSNGMYDRNAIEI